jgi:hypothetical protein
MMGSIDSGHPALDHLVLRHLRHWPFRREMTQMTQMTLKFGDPCQPTGRENYLDPKEGTEGFRLSTG